MREKSGMYCLYKPKNPSNFRMSPTVFGFSLSTSGLLPYPPSPKSIHQLTRSYLNIRPSVVRIMYLDGWSTRRTSLTWSSNFRL